MTVVRWPVGDGLWWSIARNSGAVLVANAAAKVLVVIATALIARALGPQSFGGYSTVLAYVAVIAALPELGMDAILTRDMTQQPAATSQILGAGITLRTLAVAAAMVVGWLAFRFLGNPGIPLAPLAIGMAYVLSFSFGSLSETYFRARMAMGIPAVARVSAKLAVLVLTVLALPMVTAQWRLTAALAATVGPDVLAAGCVLLLAWHRVVPNLAGWTAWKPLLQESWPLAVTAILMMVYLRGDMLILSRLAGPQAVGTYAAAVALTEPWGGMAMALGISLMSVFSRLAGGSDAASFWRVYRQSFSVLMFLLVPVCVFLALYADELVGLVYGGQYGSAGRLLTVVIWTQIFVAAGVLCSIALTAYRRQRLVVLLAATAAVVSAAVNLTLVPRYGPLASAVAAVLAHSSGPLVLAIGRSTRPFISPLVRHGALPCLASLAFVMIGRWIGGPLILSLAVCSATYLVAFTLLHKTVGARLNASRVS